MENKDTVSNKGSYIFTFEDSNKCAEMMSVLNTACQARQAVQYFYACQKDGIKSTLYEYKLRKKENNTLKEGKYGTGLHKFDNSYECQNLASKLNNASTTENLNHFYACRRDGIDSTLYEIKYAIS